MDLQLRLCKSVTHPECVLSSEVDHDADVRLDVIDSFLPGCSCKTEVCPTEDGGQATAYNIHLMENSSIQQLELDVQRLQQLLQEEKEVHAVLQSAVEHAVVDLSCHPCLPNNAQELLSNIATLEVTILKLQEEMVSLHFQLIQERNERRLAEYRLKQLPSQPLPICLRGNVEAQDATDAIHIHSEKMSFEQFQHVTTWRFKRQILVDGLWSHPNLLAEEMVRCMKSIFITLADSSVSFTKSSSWESHPSSTSPFRRLSSSSFSSLSESLTISPKMQSPQVDLLLSKEVIASGNAFDPYNVREKLSWVDIGSYSLAIEVSWMSVGKQQLEYAAGALRRFSSLIEQLAKVNPIHLSGNEKLAFWINLYNALIMHAYLAYGVPKSDLKLLSLMQKAAYTVGGHSFSAACIQYVILKMKPPAYRPQIALLLALQKLKVSEEQKKFSVETPDPLIAFALSCGMYSSPAVKIYSPRSLREELQAAQRDFIRASVGISSKGKLLVPKMLYCFAKGFVDDSNLAVWISSFLPQQQAMLVEHCMSQRRQSFLGFRNCGILPFDPRFRYLFLPESGDVAKDPSRPQSSLAPDRS